MFLYVAEINFKVSISCYCRIKTFLLSLEFIGLRCCLNCLWPAACFESRYTLRTQNEFLEGMLKRKQNNKRLLQLQEALHTQFEMWMKKVKLKKCKIPSTEWCHTAHELIEIHIHPNTHTQQSFWNSPKWIIWVYVYFTEFTWTPQVFC